MARMTCVALGEVKGSQKYNKDGPVSDIVKATAKDLIYFYHIDSCMAAAFFPNDSKDPVVGAHLAMAAPGDQWTTDSGTECAEYYVGQLKEYIGKMGYAAFVGDSGDWGAAAAKLTKGLKINNAIFLKVEEPVDAWALPGVDSAVAWLKWEKGKFRYDFPRKDCEKTMTKMSKVKGLAGPKIFLEMYKYM